MCEVSHARMGLAASKFGMVIPLPFEWCHSLSSERAIFSPERLSRPSRGLGAELVGDWYQN